jgi:hypothetical protein
VAELRFAYEVSGVVFVVVDQRVALRLIYFAAVLPASLQDTGRHADDARMIRKLVLLVFVLLLVLSAPRWLPVVADALGGLMAKQVTDAVTKTHSPSPAASPR